MSSDTQTRRSAALIMLALVAIAAFAAFVTMDLEWLSLAPPATEADPAPLADAVGKEFFLYLSAYTAWAALLLLIPVFVFVWFQHNYDQWLAYWTVSYAAYIIHLFVSMFLFFGGDFAAMTNSSRVSAFWPGMLIALWWLADVIWAHRGDVGRWVSIQRVVIHLLVLVLFVGGSAVKGELATVQLIGWALLAAAIGALVVSRINRSQGVGA